MDNCGIIRRYLVRRTLAIVKYSIKRLLRSIIPSRYSNIFGFWIARKICRKETSLRALSNGEFIGQPVVRSCRATVMVRWFCFRLKAVHKAKSSPISVLHMHWRSRLTASWQQVVINELFPIRNLVVFCSSLTTAVNKKRRNSPLQSETLLDKTSSLAVLTGFSQYVISRHKWMH